MTSTLSLYALDAELANLLAYRQERIEDRESPATPEEIADCDGAIQQYMEQLPRKVDGVAAMLRYFAEQVEFADREIKRLRQRKDQAEADSARLKACVAAVLEKQPIPARGSRKLTGAHSTLMLKTNGGLQALVVAQPDMVPDELCNFAFTLESERWAEVRALFQIAGWRDTLAVIEKAMVRTPSTALIREALLQPCGACDGRGFDLVMDGNLNGEAEDCTACGGTGCNAVPGCHLEPRGVHVEIK